MNHQFRQLLALTVLTFLAGGCDDGSSDSAPADAPGGAGATTDPGTGGSTGTSAGTGGTSSGGTGGGSSAGLGGSEAQAAGGTAGGAGAAPEQTGGSPQGEAGSAATEATGGAPSFSEVGVCGQRGEGTVDGTTFEGFEEFYLIGEEGFGEDICVVRFDVTRVGEAPAGCDDPAAGVECLWTHLVEYSNPSIVTDTGGVCANSELGLDEAGIAAITGTQAAYGFVSEYAGHNSVLMKYDEASASWDAYGNATWDQEAAAFRFDRRNGFCGY